MLKVNLKWCKTHNHHCQPLPHHHQVVFISGTREQWHPLAVIEVSPGPEVFSQIFTSKNEIDKTTFAFGEATYMLFIFRTALSDFLVSKLDFTWPWTGFHISIQILFFGLQALLCLTKWATIIIISKKEQFTVSMTLQMNDCTEKENYMEATTLRTHLAFSLRKAKAPHILTSAIGEGWWWPELWWREWCQPWWLDSVLTRMVLWWFVIAGTPTKVGLSGSKGKF